MDLKAFRKANGITQEELGEFLGIKKSFVSEIERGGRNLPLKYRRRIMENENGWDTSTLSIRSLSSVAERHGVANVSIGANVEIAVLKKEVEMLRKENEELKNILWTLAKKEPGNH